MHRLSIKDKREFYTGLARLLRSGSALPTALDLLARDTSRGVRQFVLAVNARVKQGEPLGEALLQQRPRVTDLEASIVTAAGLGGRLDRGCDQLARYFEALGRARGMIIQRIVYPVVMIHLVILMVNIETAISFGPVRYAEVTIREFIYLYASCGAIWLAWKTLNEMARYNPAVDELVSAIPIVGNIRRKFALARFFSTLDAQLEAAVNIWDAFANAARTSDSARIIAAARQGMPLLRAGERLSEVLAQKKVIPPEYVRSFRIAEEAGETDAELTAMAQRTEEMAVAALDRWSEWLPKLIYGGMLLYTAWSIVSWYKGQMDQVQNFNPFGQ